MAIRVSKMTSYTYSGSELEVFAHAVRWKSYFASQIVDFLHGDVLEVGAGIGSTTRVLRTGSQQRWTCLEPDAELARIMQTNSDFVKLDCEIACGAVQSLPDTQRFDAILYIDVLEHIADDAGELRSASHHLKSNGTLIVLAPAHQFLFTAFDQAVGHFRRYSKKSLKAAAPSGLKIERLRYLDSIGLMASLGNRLVLKSGQPNLKQIKIWDRLLVPISRVADPLLGYGLGKSVLGVWRKQ